MTYGIFVGNHDEKPLDLGIFFFFSGPTHLHSVTVGLAKCNEGPTAFNSPHRYLDGGNAATERLGQTVKALMNEQAGQGREGIAEARPNALDQSEAQYHAHTCANARPQ